LRLLRDGRLLLLGGLVRASAQDKTRSQLAALMEPLLLVSEDSGKTWTGPLDVVSAEQRQNWTEEWDAGAARERLLTDMELAPVDQSLVYHHAGDALVRIFQDRKFLRGLPLEPRDGL